MDYFASSKHTYFKLTSLEGNISNFSGRTLQLIRLELQLLLLETTRAWEVGGE